MSYSASSMTEETPVAVKETSEQRSDGERYLCEQCNKGFSQKSNLKVHLRTHSGPAPSFACNRCGKSFLSASQLKRHHSAKSCVRSEKPYVCYKVFPQKDSLLEHHCLIDSEAEPFACDICDAKFAEETVLERHLESHADKKSVCREKSVCIHSGEKPACDICSKRFAHKSSLDRHLRTHSGERPFACTVCGKTFSQKSTLKAHYIVHTGEKPFICHICSKGFVHKHHLKGHLEIHAGEKQSGVKKQLFTCEKCDRNFSQERFLIVHLRFHS